MKLPLNRPECCPISDEITIDVECLMKDLCAELTKLHNKHKKAFLNRPRLHELAIPKSSRQATRFVPECPCKFQRPIELVHLEKEERTRTTQLAYPQVRKLLLLQSKFGRIWEHPLRSILLNRLIRNSLLSLYSRLASIQPPKKPVPIHKWDDKEWKVHRKYLKRLAKHKVEPPQPKIIRKRMPLSSMFRYKTLCKPKYIEPKFISEFVLPNKPVKKVYKVHIPKRLTIIEEPKYKVPKAPKNLRKSSVRQSGGIDIRDSYPYQVSPYALLATPTERILRLAEPRQRLNFSEYQTPVGISRNALRANATKRVIELAKPKHKRKGKRGVKKVRAIYLRSEKLKEMKLKKARGFQNPLIQKLKVVRDMPKILEAKQ